MPNVQSVEEFVETVLSGDFVGALERFYATDASVRENGEAPKVGLDRLIADERTTLARNHAVRASLLDAPVVTGDQVAIAWRFEFDGRDGVTRAMEEIAWQRWSGDRIVEERFFYDPRQMAVPAA